MELDAQKKREQELERLLRTPKAVVSSTKSVEADTVETNTLIQTFLKGRFYLYESHQNTSSSNFEKDHTELEEIYEREQVLSELKDILKAWIVSVAKQTGMEETLARDEEAKIFTFGSHRLGVNSRGGDIDTLVLCPNYVDRDEHFFEQLFSLLQQETTHVKELVKVNDPKVLVPVIKMTFRGIPVDLAFAKLDVPKIDKKLKNLNDNNLLAASVDDKMVYSMNGPRNVDMIIQSVDSKEDSFRISNFRTTLKLLKLWAKNRGIYSNAMGYVTGISLAILVAKICQMFPNLKPNKLIQKFFIYYSIWKWDEFAVKIDEIRTYDTMERLNEMQWYDPKSEIGEKMMLENKKIIFSSPMMVITPAFPCMNATKKVSKTNLNAIKEQLALGKEIVQNKPIDWKKLFEKLDFFNDFYNFIEVSVLANDENEFHKWKGLIESQIIVLTKNLEYKIESEEHPRKMQLRPYPVDFDLPDNAFKFCTRYYYGVKFLDPPEGAKGEAYAEFYPPVFDFLNRMMARRTEGQFKTANLRIVHLLREELPRELFNEKVPGPKEEASNPGKRPLDKQYEQDSQFEPVIVKKVHQKEDLESKSTHFSNSATSSPKEAYTQPPTSQQEPIGSRNVKIDPPVVQNNVGRPKPEPIKMENKPAQPVQLAQPVQTMQPVQTVQAIQTNASSAIRTNVFPRAVTNFSNIDTVSLLKQSDELDDFL